MSIRMLKSIGLPNESAKLDQSLIETEVEDVVFESESEGLSRFDINC